MKKIASLFTKIFKQVFDPFLSKYGFVITETRSEKTSFSVTYRNGERYVRCGGTLHLHDIPFYYHLSFGVGSDEFPDSDWNAVALWRIVQSASPATFEAHKDLYAIAANISEKQIEEKIRTNLELCTFYAAPFLENDLTGFRQIRAMQSKIRQPYLISVPDGNGGRTIREDETSAALKEKYSQ